jgi:hypothetical protein
MKFTKSIVPSKILFCLLEAINRSPIWGSIFHIITFFANSRPYGAALFSGTFCMTSMLNNI